MCSVGPCFVLEGPGPSHGPWFVLWGPWFVLRGPGASCGALIHPAGPWFVPRRPDLSYGALLRPSGPWFVLRGPTSFCRSSSVSRALIRRSGPWSVRGALKPDRKSTSARGPSGSRGPGFGLGGNRYVDPGDWAWGEWPECPPPWDRPWHATRTRGTMLQENCNVWSYM